MIKYMNNVASVPPDPTCCLRLITLVNRRQPSSPRHCIVNLGHWVHWDKVVPSRFMRLIYNIMITQFSWGDDNLDLFHHLS